MRAGICLVLAALVLPALAPAKDATPKQIVKRFNKERVANGLPGGVKLNKTWSRRCKKHNRYMKLNGVLEHSETPGKPGYSVDGNWAGEHAVLSQDTTWKRGNPWLNAPIHLNQMLSPLLVKAGVHESRDRNCFTTFEGYDEDLSRSSVDRVYSYPRVAPFAQTAFEFPHAPQHFVGIKDGRKTGPYIYVFWDGPAPALGVLSDAELSGPGGSVAAKVLDSGTHDGDGYYLAPNSGFVLPVKPLRKRSKYEVEVTFTTAPGVVPRREFSSSFDFRTTGRHLKELGPAFTGETTG